MKRLGCWKWWVLGGVAAAEVAIVGSDLLTSTSDFCCFQPFNKVGKWGTLVEFDVDVAAHDDDGDHAAHGTPSNTTTPASNTTHSDGHNHSKRHGGHEMGRKTYEEASTFTVIADPSPPTDQAWPKVTLPESIPGSSGVNQFRGIMLNPAPEDELYTLPMIASDLSLDSPLTPRTTLLVNQTFLATLRTVPPVLQPNSCAIAVLEFFLASGNTWAPVTNLAPFLDAAAHLTTVNPTMTEVGHSHAVPYDPPETLGPESNLASPTSGVVTTALPDLCGSDPGHQASPPPVFGSKLVAPLRFNEAGKHAIFVQSSRLQDGGFVYVVGGVGRVMLAPRFVVEVGTGMESTTGLKAVEGVKISSPGVIPVANGPVDGMKGAEIGMSGTVPSPQASGGFAGIALVLFLLVAGTALFVWQRRRRGQTVSGFRTPNLTSPRIFENPGVYTELVDDFDEFLVDEDHHEEEEVGMSKLEHK